MNTGLASGEGGRKQKFFLSNHRCPEVDLLPHHNSETQIPPCWSLVPADKSSDFTFTGQSEANYLDIPSTSHCEDEEEEDEEGGTVSDWSEEDLSLHFSPSVILPSGDEESDPESIFECVDITVETPVRGQEGEALKMVPKRQIQLKKKDVGSVINLEETKKLQVKLKDGIVEGGVNNDEPSANRLLCPPVHRRPDFLLRQHSMPASLHTCSATSSDVDSHRVYRGLVAGTNQGFHLGGNSRQRLQKSFSLDETKTKMASSIIKSVLSKKMKVEQSNSKTQFLQKTAVLTSLPQSAHQQGVREEEGGKTGGGVLKVPVHAVRDMRSLLKKPHNFSFSTAPTTPESNKLGSIKAIGQEESPPPSYQQAVGVGGHRETKSSFKASVSSSGGNITKVASCFSQLQDRKPSKRFGCPITQQRQDSQEVINRIKVDDVTRPVMLDLPTSSIISSDLSELSQSERAGGTGQQAGTCPPTPASIQPPHHAPSISRHPKMTLPQEQSSISDVSSQFAPTSSQQILHSYFYTPTTLTGPAPTLYPNIGGMSYVHRPLSFIQAQLQPIRPAPTLHLLRRSEETRSGSTGQTSRPLDSFVKTCPPQQTQTAGDQESNGDTVTPATQGQPELQKRLQQQQFLCSVQGFLPAQVGSDFLIDVQGSAASSGALFTGHAPCHIMLKPKSGQCLYVNTPTPPQRKMLLDPETGQYVQVFLPAVSCANNTSVFPVPYGNHTSFVTNHAPSTLNSNTSLLSVMHFQPVVPVSSLYTHPCLPSDPPHIIS